MVHTLLEETPVRRRRRRTRWRRFKSWVRHHKALSIIGALALLLLILIICWLLYLNSKLGDIERFPNDMGNARPDQGAGENILLLGVDDPVGRGDLFDVLASGTWEPGAFRSDAIMVLHIPEDRSSAQLVSIPRDSFVPVEDHGRTKINAAFSYGGPSEMARTVEALTGVYLDHVMVIDFANFTGMIDVLGGVDVNVPDTVTDTNTGRVWTQGMQRLDGSSALAYVRQRKGLTRGDFDRIQRQQNVLRSIIGDVASTGTLANPIRLTRLVGSLTDFVAVDEDFSPSQMRSLAISSRNIRPRVMQFVTIPNTGTPTIDGASVVTIDTPLVRELFDAVSHDRFNEWLADQPEVDQLPGRASVR